MEKYSKESVDLIYKNAKRLGYKEGFRDGYNRGIKDSKELLDKLKDKD